MEFSRVLFRSPTQRERRRRRLRVKLGARPLLAASMADHPRIAFLASRAEPAQQALAALVDVHGQYAPEDAEVLCVLGGDGFMLQTLHRYGHLHRPVFGMKLGTVGFLMNHYRADDLPARLELGRASCREKAVQCV